MGLFSGSKKTYVSSSVWNLAGDEDLRPNYLRLLVTQNILTTNAPSLGDALNSGYLHGPGIRLRSFYQWAAREGNYDEIGLPTGKITDFASIDSEIAGGQIPVTPPEQVVVQTASVGSADYSYWAERWMLENEPDLIESDWSFDYNDSTGRIEIEFEDNTSVSFVPSNPAYDPNGNYIYIIYNTVVTGESEPTITGPTHTLDPEDDFPDTSDWSMVSDITTPNPVTLHETTQVIVTYSDGRPGSDTTTVDDTPTSYNSRSANYEKNDFTGSTVIGDNIVLTSLKSNMYFSQTGSVVEDVEETEVVDEVEPGVFRTTTTIVTTESIELTRTYRVDTQVLHNKSWSMTKYFMYKIGSGNTVLDSLVPPDSDLSGNFFPYIPIRLNNRFISEDFLPDVYEQAQKAYKKAMKSSFEDVIEAISDNESLEDIDYTYVVFGVSLNVKENECKKYLYTFFKHLMDLQSSDIVDFNAWKALYDVYKNASNQHALWLAAQNDPGNDLYGTPEPSVPKAPVLPSNTIRIANTSNIDTKFDFRIQWNFVREQTMAGLGKPGATVGEYWITYEGEDRYNLPPIVYENTESGTTYVDVDPIKVQKARLYWQESATVHRYLQLEGLVHYNFVYNGKYVSIDLASALTDDAESGFIVPLHYQMYKETGLVSGSQMATACCFLVFNCYQIVKIPWYASGFFKVIFVVVIAIVSVVFTGGAGIGLLGSAISIGSALGFTGLTAAIVGSIANALAAMVLATLIQNIAGNGFLGQILAAVFSFFVTGMLQGLQNFQFNWADLMKVDNILKLTDAVSGIYSAYAQQEIKSLAEESQDIMNNYKSETERISDLYAQNIGYANNLIDPMMFTTSSNVFWESRDTFLSRTLMTGSDVAAMSHDMLNNFADLTLTLPNAFA